MCLGLSQAIRTGLSSLPHNQSSFFKKGLNFLFSFPPCTALVFETGSVVAVLCHPFNSPRFQGASIKF